MDRSIKGPKVQKRHLRREKTIINTEDLIILIVYSKKIKKFSQIKYSQPILLSLILLKNFPPFYYFKVLFFSWLALRSAICPSYWSVLAVPYSCISCSPVFHWKKLKRQPIEVLNPLFAKFFEAIFCIVWCLCHFLLHNFETRIDAEIATENNRFKNL